MAVDLVGSTKTESRKGLQNDGLSHSLPKLEIGKRNDKYEKEADAVADGVMRMPDPSNYVQMKRYGSTPDISMKCAKCEEEEKLQMKPSMQRSTDGSTQYASENIDRRLNSSKGRGHALPTPLGREMGSEIGSDFSAVRIHTDANAIQMNRELGAKAFANGRDVYFNSGQYNPSSSEGKHLLAHELTHVVQQKGSGESSIQRYKWENDPSKAPPMSCQAATSLPAGVGIDILFGNNSNTLSKLDKAAALTFVQSWYKIPAPQPARVDGYASIDGPGKINWPLSCKRAEALASELKAPSDGSKGIPSAHIKVFAQGETNQFSKKLGPNRRALARIPKVPVLPPPLTSPRLKGNKVFEDINQYKTSLKKGHVSAEVRRVQQLLIDLGYNIPDYGTSGELNAETEAAIKKFQIDSGIPNTGTIDAPTISKLDKKFQSFTLPKDKNKPWTMDCILRILCHWNKHLVEKVMPSYSVETFDSRKFNVEKWNGKKWEKSTFYSGGYRNGKKKKMGLLNTTDCEQMAFIVYHEGWHAMQGKKLKTTLEREKDAYITSEQWSIDAGLKGKRFRDKSANSVEDLRQKDKAGNDIVDDAAAERLVKQKYGGVSTVAGEKPIKRVGANKVKVLRKDGTVYIRKAKKADSVKSKAIMTNQKPIDPKNWDCTGKT